MVTLTPELGANNLIAALDTHIKGGGYRLSHSGYGNKFNGLPRLQMKRRFKTEPENVLGIDELGNGRGVIAFEREEPQSVTVLARLDSEHRALKRISDLLNIGSSVSRVITGILGINLGLAGQCGTPPTDHRKSERQPSNSDADPRSHMPILSDPLASSEDTGAA